MITIRVGKWEASIEGWHWTSRARPLADYLNAMLDPDGPSGADPYPDMTAAQDAVRALKGKIVRADPPPRTVPGREY